MVALPGAGKGEGPAPFGVMLACKRSVYGNAVARSPLVKTRIWGMQPPLRHDPPASIGGFAMPLWKLWLEACIRAARRCLYWIIYLPVAPVLFLLCMVEEFASSVILPKEDRLTQTDEGY